MILLFVISRRHLEHSEEGFLRAVHLADAFHTAFAFFLLFEEFAFARDVAAVALGENVFAYGSYGFAGDDTAADRGLNGNFKHLPRDQFAEARHQLAAAFVSLFAVADHGQRVHRFAANENIEFYGHVGDEVRSLLAVHGYRLSFRMHSDEVYVPSERSAA